VPGFVGRHSELHRVRVASGHRPAVAIVGDRGVGTSALLSVAAHEVRGDYPDRQVYVDVRGGHRHPLTREQVLGRVYDRLGLRVPVTKEEADLDASAEWLRNRLTSKRMLLVLDNVDKPELVAGMLPTGGGSLVLLAGTPALSQVAHCVQLDALSDDDAVALLRQDDAPQRFTADHASAVRLVRLCGRQPLAIRLIRARINQEDHRAARSFEDAVEKTLEPLAERGDPDPAVALRRLYDVCDLAYRKLSKSGQRMVRLLTLVPGTEIGLPAAAALVGLDQKRAGETLAELARLEFVEAVSDRRYRLRHLLDQCLRDHLMGTGTLCPRCDVEAGETLPSQWRALSRFAGYFATVARQQADALTLPERDGAVTRGRADEWFGWEHDLLYGLVTDWLIGQPERPPRRVQRRLCDIATMLCQWYAMESRLLADWRRVCEVVRNAPLARQDRSVAGWVHNELAVVHRLQGNPATASRELTAALALLPYRQRSARTQVLTNLGLVQIDRRHVQESVGTLEAACRLRADRYGRALTGVALSAAHLYGNDDDHRAARLHADRCVRSFGGLDSLPSLDLEERRLMAAALNNLGLAYWRQGDHFGADEQWDKAFGIYHELGDDAGLARVTLNKAAMLLARDPAQVDKVIEGLKESLRLRGTGSPTVGTGLCYLHLGHAYARTSRISDACDEWHRAWQIFDRLGLQPEADEARWLIEQHGCGDVPPPGQPRQPEPLPGPTGILAMLGDRAGRALARVRTWVVDRGAR
jgi:tetratricopeptide (TPR) repeat protein